MALLALGTTCSFAHQASRLPATENPLSTALGSVSIMGSNSMSHQTYSKVSESFQTVNATGASVDRTKCPQFAVMSDVHMGGKDSKIKIPRAFRNLIKAEPDLDAIIICGDLTDGGRAHQFTDLAAMLNDTLPKILKEIPGTPANIPVYLMMGNHDNYDARGTENYQTILKQKDLHQYFEIKGYPFITVSTRGTANTGTSNHDDIAYNFLKEKLADAAKNYPGKPIFVFNHYPAEGTVYGSDNWGNPKLYELMKPYPQIIAFSGHSHFPLSDPRSIHQKDFTSINDGTISYAEINPGEVTEGIHPAGYQEVNEAVLVNVDNETNVHIVRWNTADDGEIVPPWDIKAPHDGKHYLYAGRTGGERPYFTGKEKVTITDLSDNQCKVEFEQATDDENVHHYLVEMLADGEVVATNKIFSGYYLLKNMPKSLAVTLGDMPGDVVLKARITAYDSFGNASVPYESKPFILKPEALPGLPTGNISFDRSGTTATQVKMNFINAEGDPVKVESGKVTSSHKFRATRKDVKNTILCPNVNGSSGPTIRMTFDLSLQNALQFEEVGLDLHALSGADIYNRNEDGNSRQFNIKIRVGEDAQHLSDFGELLDIDVAKGVGESGNVHKIWTVSNKKTFKFDKKICVELTITKGTENAGCFIGLSDIQFLSKENVAPNVNVDKPVADLFDLKFDKSGAVKDLCGNAIYVSENRPVLQENAAYGRKECVTGRGSYYGLDYKTNDAIRSAFTNGFAFEMLYATDNVGNVCPMSTQQQGGCGIEHTKDGYIGFYINNQQSGATYLKSPIKAVPGRFYHVVATYNPPTHQAKLYVDGKLSAVAFVEGDYKFSANTNAQWIAIGGDCHGEGINANWVQYAFSGKILSARMYSQYLSLDEVTWLYSGVEGEKAVAKANKTLGLLGVGYPTETAQSRATLSQMMQTHAASRQSFEDNNALLQAIDEYKMSTVDIQLPVSGKAYRLVSVGKYGEKYYLQTTTSGSVWQFDAAQATAYVCKKLGGGKFLFVNNAGQYFTWFGEAGGYNDNKGYVDAYTADACAINVEKMVSGEQVSPFQKTSLFGLMALSGQSSAGTAQYIAVGAHGKSVTATSQILNDQQSSSIQLEEVPYANTPALNTIEGNMISIPGAVAIGTFSAPFATEIEEGIQAYYVSSTTPGFAHLSALQGIVPARQGVVLVAKKAGKVTMVPAQDPGQQLTGNLLQASAGQSLQLSEGDFILTKYDGNVGFFKGKVGTTLAMNKAFLNLATEKAGTIQLRFGDEVTAIEDIELEELSLSSPVYDLSGRRVHQFTEGGIYVQNGKKFIVRQKK